MPDFIRRARTRSTFALTYYSRTYEFAPAAIQRNYRKVAQRWSILPLLGRPGVDPLKETPIVRECLTCFSHHGFQVLMSGWKTPYEVSENIKGIIWRQNTGAVKIGPRFVQFGISGLPDLIGVSRGGLFIGCEAKSDTGKVSEIQKWFHLLTLKLGGYVFVARSYDECDQALKRAGL